MLNSSIHSDPVVLELVALLAPGPGGPAGGGAFLRLLRGELVPRLESAGGLGRPFEGFRLHGADVLPAILKESGPLREAEGTGLPMNGGRGDADPFGQRLVEHDRVKVGQQFQVSLGPDGAAVPLADTEVERLAIYGVHGPAKIACDLPAGEDGEVPPQDFQLAWCPFLRHDPSSVSQR